MFDKLKELKDLSDKLEPSESERRYWSQKVFEYSSSFIDNIAGLPVYSKKETDLKALEKIDFSEEARPLAELMQIIATDVDGTGINPAAPGHLGYVPGGGVFPTALGDFLAAVTNRYAGIFYANPGAVLMEEKCIQWMAQLIGYPATCAGNLSSGGSIATLTALTAARDHHQITPENVRTRAIYLTRQAHHCILKALRIAALDYAQIRFVPMQSAYQMDIEALKRAINEDISSGITPFLIVGSAGTTDTGSIDPLEEIAAVSALHNCWFHIDAAYGGFFMLLNEMRARFKGIDKSDSIVLDPHKGLFLSYGTGAVLIKNREAALNTHYYRANYMQDAYSDYEVLNPADVSPELTKHFRGMRMWLSLQLLGIAPFRAALQEKLLLAKYFQHKVNKLGFEVGPEPELSVCLFRIRGHDLEKSNAKNKAITAEILATGKIFLSSTTIEEVYWLRICVMVFRTHKEHIDLLLDLLEKYRS